MTSVHTSTGPGGRETGPAPGRTDHGSFVSFADPDWSDWYALYPVPERAGDGLPT